MHIVHAIENNRGVLMKTNLTNMKAFVLMTVVDSTNYLTLLPTSNYI